LRDSDFIRCYQPVLRERGTGRGAARRDLVCIRGSIYLANRFVDRTYGDRESDRDGHSDQCGGPDRIRVIYGDC
jgi:hypothetical protein